MDEETELKPPSVNGYAVPIKEAPPRSGKPVHRTQSLESEDLEMEIMGQSYDTINEEDDQAGPLIPPPKGFGSPSKPPPGRPLSTLGGFSSVSSSILSYTNLLINNIHTS
jgi:hypothetical protein